MNYGIVKTIWQQRMLAVPFIIFLSFGGMVGCDRVSLKSSKAMEEKTPTREARGISQETTTQTPLPSNINNQNFVVDAVHKVGPAIVRIDAAREVKSRKNGLGSEFPDDFFGIEPPSSKRRVERGTGSGFLISSDGQILTNAHVIDGADRVRVFLKDGRNFEGKVLGEDTVTDVAVVKIDAQNLPMVSLGNSENLQPGEWAIAIGNPLGLDNSVTMGIISATGRSSRDVGVPDKRIGFIQTDAAINPGNSGGPLLNSAGEVIGMNTAIIQGAQGLGFAIPINDAQRIAKQLLSTGKVQHAYLGIEMTTLTPELKEEINNNPNTNIRLTVDKGVLIFNVIAQSPAAKSGLRRGDIIQKINNQEITKSETVQQIVQNSDVGTPLNIEILRQDKIITLPVTPGNLPTKQSKR